MNLHLFIDPLGYYSSQFAARVNRIDPLHNTIVNISIPKVKHEHILYFDGYKKDLKKYKKQKTYRNTYISILHIII